MLEALETRQLLVSDWTSPYYVGDVNDDGEVAPIDVLIGINELQNRTLIDAEGRLPNRAMHPDVPFFYDVDGDGFLAPRDVLNVINALNGDQAGPTITVGLVMDTAANGGADNDLVTSDARISGRVLDDLTGVHELEVQVDDGPRKSIKDMLGRDGVFTFDPELLPGGPHDKSYTLKFFAEDGRQFASTSELSFTFDTTAPSAPTQVTLDAASDTGASSSDGITNINRPKFSGDASPGSIINLLANGQIVATTVANSPWTLTADPLDDGEYDFTVTAQDAAGNVSAVVGPVHMTIDTIAPEAPSSLRFTAATDSGRSSTDGVTNFKSPVLTGSAEAASRLTLRNGTAVLGSAVGGVDWQFTLYNLADGVYSLAAIAEDLAGNVSDLSVAFSAMIDTVAPGVPTGLAFTMATDTGRSNSDGVTNKKSPVLTGNAETNVDVMILDGNSEVGMVSGANWQLTLSNLNEGGHSFTALASDLAGNMSGASIAFAAMIDTQAPAAPVSIKLTTATDSGFSATDGITNIINPSTTGDAEPGSLVTLLVNGSAQSTQTATGTWTIATGDLSEGSHTLTATAEDLAGNLSDLSSAVMIVIDTTAPATPTNLRFTIATDSGRSDSDGVTKNHSPELQGAAESDSQVIVLDDGDVVATVAGGIDWRLALTQLAEGNHSFTAIAMDLAGNESLPSAAFSAVIDLTAPAAPTGLRLTAATDSGQSSTDGVTNAMNPMATGNADGGALVTLFVNGQAVGQEVANSPWTVATGNLMEGPHTLTATAEDLAGNISAASAAYAITVDRTAPAELQFALSATSDTGIAGDSRTRAARVTLVGQTEPRAIVRLMERGLNSLASLNGGFQFPGVSLEVGEHTLTVEAVDLAGNIRSFPRLLERIDQPATADPVLAWNQILLEAVRLDATSPPVATR